MLSTLQKFLNLTFRLLDRSRLLLVLLVIQRPHESYVDYTWGNGNEYPGK